MMKMAIGIYLDDEDGNRAFILMMKMAMGNLF